MFILCSSLEMFWIVSDPLTIGVLFQHYQLWSVTVLQSRFEFYFSDSLVSYLYLTYAKLALAHKNLNFNYATIWHLLL